MTDHPLDPQAEYEALAAALQRAHEHQDPAARTALHAAVVRATAAWQRGEAVRATREKEFRYHVVKLKLLVAGAAQTLAALSGLSLPEAA
jgi:hypothetical protein